MTIAGNLYDMLGRIEAVGNDFLYGEAGKGFSRMNLASPRSGIRKALDRLLGAARARGFARAG